MILFNLILIIIGGIIGFFISKYIYDKVKWADKREALETKWRLKLETLENEYKNQIHEIQKNKELMIKELVHEWELKYTKDLIEIKELIQSAEKYMRHDAIKRSKRTLLGKLWEQVSPYMPKFPFKPSDMKFLGSPIDFIVFDGASENDIKKIIFLEIKSGNSKLSKQERKLRRVIEEGNVVWKLFNIDKPEEIKIEEERDKIEIEGEATPHEVYEVIDEKIKSVKKDKK